MKKKKEINYEELLGQGTIFDLPALVRDYKRDRNEERIIRRILGEDKDTEEKKLKLINLKNQVLDINKRSFSQQKRRIEEKAKIEDWNVKILKDKIKELKKQNKITILNNIKHIEYDIKYLETGVYYYIVNNQFETKWYSENFLIRKNSIRHLLNWYIKCVERSRIISKKSDIIKDKIIKSINYTLSISEFDNEDDVLNFIEMSKDEKISGLTLVEIAPPNIEMFVAAVNVSKNE
jgi:hypothetical protein